MRFPPLVGNAAERLISTAPARPSKALRVLASSLRAALRWLASSNQAAGKQRNRPECACQVARANSTQVRRLGTVSERQGRPGSRRRLRRRTTKLSHWLTRERPLKSEKPPLAWPVGCSIWFGLPLLGGCHPPVAIPLVAKQVVHPAGIVLNELRPRPRGRQLRR